MQKLFLTLFVVLTFNLSAEMLTLQRVIEQSLAHHPDIASLQLKIKQSNAAYDASFSAYLPQVNLQANYNFAQTYVFPQNGAFHTVDDTGWSAGANLKQKLWDFSKTSALIDASKIDEHIANLSLKDAKSLLAYKVKSLYELMVVQKEAIVVRTKDLEAKEAYYKQAKALVSQGLKTNADASRFLSAVYITKDTLAIAEASYEKAKNSLELYMGEKISKNVMLDTTTLQEELEVPSQLENSVVANNYQLQVNTQSIAKNELLHKATQASHFGSIDAVASYTHFDTLNIYDAKNLALTLNIPLYSGGKTSAEVQQVALATQIAKEQKLSKILALKEELESLLIDIKRYNKTIVAKQAQEQSAQETLDVLSGRYKEGLTTYIEVLDATSLLLNAKLGLLESYYLKSIAINKVHYLQGKL